jgi:hypothetical protein
MSCTTPLADDLLVAYWSADLEPNAEQALEVHLYGCSECTTRMTALAQIIDELAALHGELPPVVVTRAELATFRALGRKIDEASIEPFGRADMAVTADVDLLAVAIQLAPRGVDRIDIEYCTVDGTVYFTFENAPIAVDATEVILACERHLAAGHAMVRFRLIGHSGAGRNLLADVSVVNTAFVE